MLNLFTPIFLIRKELQQQRPIKPIKTVAAKVTTTFLVLALTLNYFVFIPKNILQVKGCEMDTVCAPAYANTFMAKFEEKKKIYIYIYISTY